MWTAPIVMARFQEAADVEQRSPMTGMPMVKSCWPVCEDHEEGRSVADKLEDSERRKDPPSADALSRYYETLDWGLTRIHDEKRRLITWTWAFCAVSHGKRNFGTACKRHGWARPTAYRRLTDTFERIADGLANERILLRYPHHFFLRQPAANNAIRLVQSDTDDAIPNKAYRTEPSRDMIRTEEDAERFAAFLEKRNKREAKRRAKLGLEAA